MDENNNKENNMKDLNFDLNDYKDLFDEESNRSGLDRYQIQNIDDLHDHSTLEWNEDGEVE